MAFKSSQGLFIFIFIATLTLMTVATHSLPFVVFHGISDECSNGGVTSFTNLLSNWSGAQGYCIEIGNGAWDSWFMPFQEQTEIACDKVKQISELKDGYNIIGLSQGNLVGRGVLEFCDGAPPVKNFISLAGPHAGEASIPFCGSGMFCVVVDVLLKFAIYSDFLQEHLAPAGYIKIPTDIDDYLKCCQFLPKLNNEVYKNATYKARFSSLQNLVLIMFDDDGILVPKETSWFGYFPDGSWDTVLSPQQTKLYIEDWIGLKTLDEAGKVKFIKVPGKHLEISLQEMKTYILPYLLEETPEQLTTESSSSSSSSLWSFIDGLVRLEDKKLKLHTPVSLN